MSAADIIVPNAPAFLDPLIEIDTCYYYSVPRFFSFHHPNTRWLISMIKAKEEDRVKRKMELNPELFKGKYFQMMDYPRLYFPHDPSVTPMFKRQSVLYLTALGVSIYLRSLPLIDLILFHKDPYDEVIGNPNEPQFASHLQDLNYGDFHAFPPCVIMLRMYCFECTVSLLQAGWNPTQPLALPMRRKFERRAFYFFDWLEAALGLLSERPLYPLQSLILNMTKNMTMYKHLMLPLTHMLPPTPKHRVATGLIDVEDLPVGTRMVGVRSLLEMAEDYGRYLQMRSCAVEVASLKREAVAVGLNPEILMIQALDYDGYVPDKAAPQDSGNNAWRGGGIGVGTIPGRHWAVEHDSRLTVNANNSATNAAAVSSGPAATNTNVSASKKRKMTSASYASEGCRVMHYAMEKDKSCKRMHVCLDSLIAMTKRCFFVNGERLPAESPRARDIRNVVVLLLNMIQREQEKPDVIFAKIQSGYKKFQHLEEHKLLENRRLTSIFNISKMIAALTRILLHSKELVYFISAEFPPFHSNTIDIRINHLLQTKFNEIKGGVVQEFNSINDGWTHLSKDMLEEVAKIKSMQLHFHVGVKPTAAAILQAKKAARKSALKNKPKNKNMSNTNSCFVTFKKVQRVSRKSGRGSKVETFASRESMPPLPALPLSPPPPTTQTVASPGACFSSPTALDSDDDEQALTQSPLPLPLQQHQKQLGLSCGSRGNSLADADVILMEDLAEESDRLSETSLLMTSLYKEVQDLLRPHSAKGEASETARSVLGTSQSKGDRDDIATIEPEPGSGEHGTDSFLSTGQSHACSSPLPTFSPLLQTRDDGLFDW